MIGLAASSVRFLTSVDMKKNQEANFWNCFLPGVNRVLKSGSKG